MVWGAAHPKEKRGPQGACGYPATSYAGKKPPAPQVPDLAAFNEALARVNQAKEDYGPGNEQCRQAFGFPPWCTAVMPHWFPRWREWLQNRRPELHFLDRHTKCGKVGIDLPPHWKTGLSR